MSYKYRIGIIKSDMGGCFYYRVVQPFAELKNKGITYSSTPFLPSNLYEPPDDTLVRWVEQFDLIILQRCFKLDVFKRLRRACDIAGRKLVFETDDDYINLPPYNPCYAELNQPGVLEGFKEILRGSDYITVSTQELKDVYYIYNRNIKVLPNNVENVCAFKDEYIQPIGPDGKVNHHSVFGFLSYPTHVQFEVGGEQRVEKLFKIGYTATPTHRQDYLTIRPHLEKFFDKNPNSIMFYFGDEWFVNAHPSNHKNVVFVPTSQLDLYLDNIRVFDVGIAPLVPDVFNMGKSSLKLLEYGRWGIPAVAPNYITYNRHFTHGKDYLGYNNGREFYDYLTMLKEDQELRSTIGRNSFQMISQTRTEEVNSQERFDYYAGIIESTPRHYRFLPNKRNGNDRQA